MLQCPLVRLPYLLRRYRKLGRLDLGLLKILPLLYKLWIRIIAGVKGTRIELEYEFHHIWIGHFLKRIKNCLSFF